MNLSISIEEVLENPVLKDALMRHILCANGELSELYASSFEGSGVILSWNWEGLKLGQRALLEVVMCSLGKPKDRTEELEDSLAAQRAGVNN